MNDHQNQTAFIIMDIGAASFGPSAVFEALGADALLATGQVIPSAGVSFSLPDNHWTLEVASWFAIGLAGLQQSIVEYATGPSPEHLANGEAIPLSTLGDPHSAVTKAICASQMIKSPGGYQNFSALGLFCILAIGGSIMLFSLNVESIVGFVQTKMERGKEGRTRWIADSIFQVQRMMYEGRGYEKWEGQKDVVPVYLGEDLRLPVELEDGKLGLRKKTAAGKISSEEEVVKVKEISSRSKTTHPLKCLALEEPGKKDIAKMNTEMEEISNRNEARPSAENVLASI
jgi:hypothetical protein